VYTRTITSPRWGVRATGKSDETAYTIFVAQDRGGGSVVLPSPDSSTLVAQDFESIVAIGRLRRDIGRSFASFLFTDREDRGGGSNRVFGPDFQWNPSEADQVTGQLLLALTKNPERPDLSPNWRSQSFSSHAAQASWNHSTRRIGWFLEYQDFGNGFRADDGYVPQVGYRRGLLRISDRFYPDGLFSRVVPLFVEDYSADRSGRTLLARTYPGVQFRAKANATGEVDCVFLKTRAGGKIFDRRQIAYSFSLTPGSALPNLSADGYFGGDVDFVNARAGRGGLVNASATVRTTDHLELVANASRQWLDVRANERDTRLFTAQVERLKATYNFDARTFLRAVGEYVSTRRDPAAYGISVPRQEGLFTASALFAYKLNWQTVLFLGYGDDRDLDQQNDLVRRRRQFFFKASYAFQR
jgi:hypothetical protein